MRILTVQDISCLGQCSMAAAMPVLTACGHETCMVPTALLSTHTGGFRDPAVLQLADFIPQIREHWLREGIRFDAMYTGYLGSIPAIEEAKKMARDLLKPGSPLIVDPAMADHGKLYRGFDDAYVRAMGELCSHADMILPNITEAAMLTGLPFQEIPDEAYLSQLLEALPQPCVVLTGAGCRENETGAAIREHGKRMDYRHPKIGRPYHGTGDLFASALVGSYLRGRSLYDSAKIGADMVCRSIENSLRDPDHWYGVKYETAMDWLVQAVR